MKLESFTGNVFVGFTLAVLAAATFYILSIFFPATAALRLVISMVTLLYIGYLLAAINVKAGKVALPLIIIGAMAVALLSGISLSFYLALHLFAVWLVRVIYLHRPLLACLDFLASGASAAAACIALDHTHSLFIAIWSFFLLQAVMLSALFNFNRNLHQRGDNGLFENGSPGNRSFSNNSPENEKFSRALRTAEAAFKQLNITD